jgi:uncharacterized membrane protein
MPLEGKSARRLLLTLFVLCVTLISQSASFAAEQETHHSSEHCCGLCHIGPLPILPAAAATVVAPVFSPVWVTAAETSADPREVLTTSAASRAPPA